MRFSYGLDGGGNGAMERALGDDAAVQVLSGAQLSMARVRESAGEWGSERE